MTSDALNRYLTLGANVRVILGILFLAYELHQNNELLMSQANLELSKNRADANELMATDANLARLLTARDTTALSEVDLFMRERYYVSVFTKWEWEYRQYQGGLIDDAYLPVSDWAAIMQAFPGMRAVWAVDRHRGRSPGFVQFMDDKVVR